MKKSLFNLTAIRKLIIFSVAIIFSYDAFCQDVITKRDGTDISAKVLEVTTNEVKYKLFEEPDGVTYVARKSDILMIRYESGRKDIFANNSYSELYTTHRTPVEGIVLNMKYNKLKTLYNYKEYEPTIVDRHNPSLLGLASFFIPGLGECINNEWGRGLGKFFGSAIFAAAGSLCIYFTYYDYYYDSYSFLCVCASVCYAAVLTIDIWSIVDAIRIAKVKNMYEQDLRAKYAFDLNLYPSFNRIPMGTSLQTMAGFTLALRF